MPVHTQEVKKMPYLTVCSSEAEEFAQKIDISSWKFKKSPTNWHIEVTHMNL